MYLLQVLKLDGNRFDDLPADLDRLSALTTLCLDRQRPRLLALPPVVSKMNQLQVGLVVCTVSVVPHVYGEECAKVRCTVRA